MVLRRNEDHELNLLGYNTKMDIYKKRITNAGKKIQKYDDKFENTPDDKRFYGFDPAKHLWEEAMEKERRKIIRARKLIAELEKLRNVAIEWGIHSSEFETYLRRLRQNNNN